MRDRIKSSVEETLAALRDGREEIMKKALSRMTKTERAAYDSNNALIESLTDQLDGLLEAQAKKKAASARKRTGTAKKKTPSRRRRRVQAPTKPDPVVPDRTFEGMGPTAAYKHFRRVWGEDYTVRQIATALLAGGVETGSERSLLTGLYSLRRRERARS